MEEIIHLLLFSFSYFIQIFLFTLGAYYTVIMISGWIPYGEEKTKKSFRFTPLCHCHTRA
jgi:hypothetical protein